MPCALTGKCDAQHSTAGASQLLPPTALGGCTASRKTRAAAGASGRLLRTSLLHLCACVLSRTRCAVCGEAVLCLVLCQGRLLVNWRAAAEVGLSCDEGWPKP